MRIDRWIRALLPREDKFLSLFLLDIENLTLAGRTLCNLLEATSEVDRVRLVKEVEALEHRGDELTHAVFTELGRSFITPYDREDIAGLASALDNIADNIDQAATCIHLYGMTEIEEPERDLAGIIERSVRELHRAIPLLRDLHNSDQIREACVRVNAFENQADGVFHRALARIFQQEKDPIALIKRRELLMILESATDRCEDAAVLLENILVKYA